MKHIKDQTLIKVTLMVITMVIGGLFKEKGRIALEEMLSPLKK
jgi:hypothetical protein